MSAAARLAAFALALSAVFAASALAGRALGPFERAAPGADAVPHREGAEPAPHDDDAGDPVDDRHGHEPDAADPTADGLAVAARGLAVEPAAATIEPGATEPLEFRIVDAAGETVREFDETHERRMHLILVRRDLSGFQHVHPEQGPDGSWAAPVRLADPGSYRAFADFSTGGSGAVLAFDLHVPGSFAPATLPASAESVSAGPYTVSLERPRVHAGEEATLAFAVTRAGAPAELQPYLGAGGHLVILREGDLAFLHTHPDEHGDEGEPGRIAFETSFPTPGRYRAFLQFRAGGSVHTAAFTIEVGRE